MAGFGILAFVDDLEGASFYAKKSNMSSELLNEINRIHDDLVELEPFIVDDEDEAKLQDGVEQLIGELKAACKKPDESLAGEKIKALEKNISALKADLA